MKHRDRSIDFKRNFKAVGDISDGKVDVESVLDRVRIDTRLERELLLGVLPKARKGRKEKQDRRDWTLDRSDVQVEDLYRVDDPSLARDMTNSSLKHLEAFDGTM